MVVSSRDKVSAWVRELRNSSWASWASVAGRIVLAGLALLLLAWIGWASSAQATPTSTPSLASSVPFDASANTPPTPPPPAAPAAPAATRPPATSRTRASPEDPVYVNEATADELRRLPGVGPKRAEAILAHRNRVGRFRRVEDLMRVKGIGRATIRKWRSLVRVESRPADAGVRPPS